MHTLLLAAGLGQIALALASLAIPRTLGWRADTGKLRPLTRQVFWIWASYIWVTHVCFGLVSALAPDALLDGSVLARAVCGFIALWWGARLTLQFTVMDRSARPAGTHGALLEGALVFAFIACATVYATAALLPLR